MTKALNKREIQAMQTREKLVKTSKELIIKYGYKQISVSRICQECRVAKGTFYIYFSSKKDIVYEILADINIHMFSKKWSSRSTARERMKEYMHVYLETIQNQGMAFTREALKILMDETIESALVYSNKHMEMVETILSDGKATGEVDSQLDIAFLSKALQSMFYGIMMSWCAQKEDVSILEFGEPAIQLLLGSFFKNEQTLL